jgi:hypothetical protein
MGGTVWTGPASFLFGGASLSPARGDARLGAGSQGGGCLTGMLPRFRVLQRLKEGDRKEGAAPRALARDELGNSCGALWAVGLGVGGLYMRQSKFRVDRAAGFAEELSMATGKISAPRPSEEGWAGSLGGVITTFMRDRLD